MKHGSLRGFTLIELMLVVAIVGTLAAASIPAYKDYTIRARMSEAFVLARPVQQAISHYHDRWGVMPRDNAAAGLPPAPALRGVFVEGIQVNEGVIRVSFSKEVAQAAVLQIRPARSKSNLTGALIWLCEKHAEPDGFTAWGTAVHDEKITYGMLTTVCKG